jgi:RHS repeat-associated protein
VKESKVQSNWTFFYVQNFVTQNAQYFTRKYYIYIVHFQSKYNTTYTTNFVGLILSENSSSSYRYGFNGKEKDDEVKGEGNSYDFGARMYDCRIGRWLSRDKMESNYPFLSPYTFVANNPLFFIDPDGNDIGESDKYKGDINAQSATKLAYSNEIVKQLFDLFSSINSGVYRTEENGKLSNHELYFGTNTGNANGLTEISIWDAKDNKWKTLRNAEKQILDANFKIRLEINVLVFKNEDNNPSQVGENLDVLVHELYVHANIAVKILTEWEDSGKSIEDLTKLKKDLTEWIKAGGNDEHKMAAENKNEIFTTVSKSFMKQLWDDFSAESDIELKKQKRLIYSKFVGRLVSETIDGGSDEFEKVIIEYDTLLKEEKPEKK